MEKEIIKVLKYFSFFAYYPTLEEIYTFLQAKINKNSLNIELDRMVKQKLIVNCKLKIENSNLYTPPQYSIPTSPRLRGASKYQISKKKLENWKFKTYIKLLSLVPQIKLVGLSGSISMMNAKENDDIDLFIITAKNRLFTGRLITLILAQILGLRRSRDLATQFFQKDKVCLNLFFDENNLKVPHFKQTLFVGHEVLQMKPIVVKGDIYKRFLEANEWVFRIFPNASHVIPAEAGIQAKITKQKMKLIDWIPVFTGMTCLLKIKNLGDWVESQLKRFQLRLINKHKTTEIITSSQLWFHPDDFEKKLKTVENG